MNTNWKVALATCLLFVTAAPLVAQEEHTWPKSFNLLLGRRTLDDGDLWVPADDQNFLGGDFEFGRDDWPLMISLGFSTSREEQESMLPDPEDPTTEVLTNVTGTVWEIDVGIVRYWRREKKLRPFLGGGVPVLFAEVERQVDRKVLEKNDTSLGIFTKAGVVVRVSPHFSIGGEARWVGGTDVKILDHEGDANYRQFGAVFNWTW